MARPCLHVTCEIDNDQFVRNILCIRFDFRLLLFQMSWDALILYVQGASIMLVIMNDLQ